MEKIKELTMVSKVPGIGFKELHELTGYSIVHLRKEVLRKNVPAYTYRGRLVFMPEDVEKFINQKNMEKGTGAKYKITMEKIS